MIRLFRKIRHQLLSENKYGLYILYASGEVVLVMIGILLALQIDSWHDNRTQEHQNLSYENLLAVDLVQDTLMISQKLRLLVHDTTQLSSFVNRMSSEDVTIDTLIQIARFKFNPWIFAGVTFSSNTFTSLRSTGDLNTFDSGLQKQLLVLNELQQEYYNSVRVDDRSYLDQATYYNQKYPFNDKGHIYPDSKLSEAIWKSAQ